MCSSFLLGTTDCILSNFHPCLAKHCVFLRVCSTTPDALSSLLCLTLLSEFILKQWLYINVDNLVFSNLDVILLSLLVTLIDHLRHETTCIIIVPCIAGVMVGISLNMLRASGRLAEESTRGAFLRVKGESSAKGASFRSIGDIAIMIGTESPISSKPF